MSDSQYCVAILCRWKAIAVLEILYYRAKPFGDGRQETVASDRSNALTQGAHRLDEWAFCKDYAELNMNRAKKHEKAIEMRFRFTAWVKIIF